jgi:tRNA (guanine37-N1)-methyltransferase
LKQSGYISMKDVMSFSASVLTLFPDMFPGPLGHSLAGSALKSGLWSLKTLDIRDFADNKHRSVDDTPAGGGAGMVLRADVVGKAVEAAMVANPDVPVLALTPRGTPLTQARVRRLADGPGAILLCGRFEGFDERLFDQLPIEEISVGDYILSGGELGALSVLDAVVRLLPGVMGSQASGTEESFENDLLEYPHYTRPRDWRGALIPEILLSGDHAKISEWRQRQSERVTQLRRPDLWERIVARRAQADRSPSGAKQPQKKKD